MNVIRHYDVSACHPYRCHAPGFQQNFVSSRISKKWFSIFRADREENDNRYVVPLAHWLVRRMFAPNLLHIAWNIMGRDGARPSKFFRRDDRSLPAAAGVIPLIRRTAHSPSLRIFIPINPQSARALRAAICRLGPARLLRAPQHSRETPALRVSDKRHHQRATHPCGRLGNGSNPINS